MTCLDNLVLCVDFGSPPAGQVAGTFWQTKAPMCISTLVSVPDVSCPSSKIEKGSKGMKDKRVESPESLGDMKATGGIARQNVTETWRIPWKGLGDMVNLWYWKQRGVIWGRRGKLWDTELQEIKVQ